MEKVKVKIKVNNYKIENIGILDKEVLKTKDQETEVEFDMEKLILTRKNKDIFITIDFKNSTMNYIIPETNQKFSNKLVILSLTNTHKKYNIMYQMEDDIFNLIIKYEKV